MALSIMIPGDLILHLVKCRSCQHEGFHLNLIYPDCPMGWELYDAAMMASYVVEKQPSRSYVCPTCFKRFPPEFLVANEAYQFLSPCHLTRVFEEREHA